MNALNVKQSVCSTGRYLAAATAVLGMACIASAAGAQGVPRYVVSSHATLVTGVGGPQGNIAVNSRGDFFVNMGNGAGPLVVDEFPADGSPAIPIFTVPTGYSYGTSGVNVDSNDNLFITVFFGFGGADSGMYEFPYTNGTYPAAYVYSAGSPPSPCFAAAAATSTAAAHGADTNVCAIGSYISAAYYYWQPFAITADYTGSTYMYSNYDNTLGSAREGFFYCNLLCNDQDLGAGAAVLVKGLPYEIQSFAGNPIAPSAGGAPGDIYWVDGHTVSYLVNSAAQATAGTQNITVLDSAYNNPTGIAFDKAGNLYVTDNTGIWETPLVNGVLVDSSKFLLFPVAPASYTGFSMVPAIDTLGDVFYAPYYGDIEKGQLFAGTFPAAPVGTASGTKTFTITFDSAVTLSAITAMQGNAPATEFAVTAGSCTSGTAFAAGSTCAFTATFTPSAAGPRSGSVVITDTTGAQTVTYLKGVGTGTAVTVDPGTPVLVGSTGLVSPSGISLDGAGNVFVADPAANAVYEYPVGGGAAVSLGSGLSVPTGVAADAAGNVFIVNQGTAATDSTGVGEGTVVEVPNIGGTLTTASQTTVLTGLQLPTDLVIDSTGNFFISNTAANVVLQFPSVSRYGAESTSVSLGTGLSGPTGLALDAGDHLYIADTGNTRVIAYNEGNQSVVGAGLALPTGVAVDASGSVIIADQGTGRLLRVPNEAGHGLNADDQVLLDSPLYYPTSIRLDGAGNLYGSDNTEADIYELQRTTGAINFLAWDLNTTSGPETIVLSSTGVSSAATPPNPPPTDGDIKLGNPLYAPVPASTGLKVTNSPSAVKPSANDAGTLCPSGAGATLPAGQNCILSAVFSPTVLGPVNYPLVLAAPGSNTATPTVNLIGSGVSLDAATATIAVTSPTGPLTYFAPFTVTFTITPTGDTPTPTGTVVFSFDGQDQRPLTIPTGSTSVSITFSGVNAGDHTVQAHYEGDANYASVETGVLNLTINKASETETLVITGDSSDPLSAAPTDTVSFNVTLTPAVDGLFQGTVTFTANGQVIGTSTVSETKVKNVYGAYLTLKTLPLGFYSVTATYSGSANYVPLTTSAISLVISNPTFTVTPSTQSATATATSPGIINLKVESYSDFQGGVDFACTGLPANAYCIFRPGLITLQNLPYDTVTTVSPASSVLAIQVDESSVVAQGSQPSSIGWIGAVLAAGLLLYSRRKRSIRGLIGTGLLVLIGFGGIAALNGCSGNSVSYVTPPGNYQITVTATATPLGANGNIGVASGNISTTFQVNLTVK